MDRNEIKSIVMGYRPIDDNFMRIIFQNNLKLAEYVIQIFLSNKDLKIIEEETQRDINLVGARSVCLDVYAKDSNGKIYDIEIQRSNSGANPHRARYHSSALDVDNLKKMESYEKLPDVYIIFVTEKDIFKGNEPVYWFERMNTKTGEHLNDGTHIVYINGEYNDVSTDIGKLLHDFRCVNANEMLCEPMAEITKTYKETAKGVDFMCEAVERLVQREKTESLQMGMQQGMQKGMQKGMQQGMQKGMQQGMQQGMQKGMQQGMQKGMQKGIAETIKSLIKDGTLSKEKISQIVGLPIEKINEIASEI